MRPRLIGAVNTVVNQDGTLIDIIQMARIL